MRLKENMIINEEIEMESNYQAFLIFSDTNTNKNNKIERLYAFSPNDSSAVRLLPRKTSDGGTDPVGAISVP